MAATNVAKNISFRRQRTYANWIKWSDQMNSDLLSFYEIARADASPGYMIRLKVLWDNNYPQFDHLSAKHLRQQATFVASRSSCQRNSKFDPSHLRSTITTSPQNQPSTSADELQRKNLPATVAPPTRNGKAYKDRKLPQESKGTQDLAIDCIELSFWKNYEEYLKIPINERPFKTTVDRRINPAALETVNNTISKLVARQGQLSFWEVNVAHYSAAITLLHSEGKLRPAKNTKKHTRQDWTVQHMTQINSIRRKISHITLTMQCAAAHQFTHKQKKVCQKVKKLCGNLKVQTLNAKLAQLKHKLKVCVLQMNDRKQRYEKDRINALFTTNQKAVYRKFKGNQVTVAEAPETEATRNFWSSIWEKETPIQTNSDWFAELEKSYCTNAMTQKYNICLDILVKTISKMPNNKAPGPDSVTGFWVKNLTALHKSLCDLLSSAKEGVTQLPDWLVLSRTILLPKSENTSDVRNYRPIACQNCTYKLYTGILNCFLENHCIENSIITEEQAGGKRGSWGCTDQLLINKMILDEVKQHRRNIFMMWFDYKKAFDSVSHEWLIEALKLAKVPQDLLFAITNLTRKWSTVLHMPTEQGTASSGTIHFKTGILQGDCLSLLLFILCVNPLSFLLSRSSEGYKIGQPGMRTTRITHLLFVDDLKTFSCNMADALNQLRIITKFSQSIGMKFGMDKCAYINIERGHRKSLGKSIVLNGIDIRELQEGETYKYLGLDEDISYKGHLNKTRLIKEYFSRVRKIWKSQLTARNKVIAHNTFAIPVLVPTFGILEWTKEEVDQIDVKTRKILTLNQSFHRNSNVARLYTTRDQGGRGLNSATETFISRIVAVAEHVRLASTTSTLLREVHRHEKEKLLRLASNFCATLNIVPQLPVDPRDLARAVRSALKKENAKAWTELPQHGFVQRKQTEQAEYDSKLANKWLSKPSMTSHVEGYIFAMQEQEIRTKSLDKKRNANSDQHTDDLCRHCKSSREDIFHLLCSCPELSLSLYLPLRHNEVAKLVYIELMRRFAPEEEIDRPRQTFSNGNVEVWWDHKISLSPPVKYNRPDIVLWSKNDKICRIIEICVPLDVNVENEEKIKRDKYKLLATGLHRMYEDYTFAVIPIVVGATGYIPKSLVVNLGKCGIKDAVKVIPKMQQKALYGSMKILKAALKTKWN